MCPPKVNQSHRLFDGFCDLTGTFGKENDKITNDLCKKKPLTQLATRPLSVFKAVPPSVRTQFWVGMGGEGFCVLGQQQWQEGMDREAGNEWKDPCQQKLF